MFCGNSNLKLNKKKLDPIQSENDGNQNLPAPILQMSPAYQEDQTSVNSYNKSKLQKLCLCY